MAKTIFEELADTEAHLRQTRKAILGRGGTISATAGLDAIPKAIFDIPATSSIAFYTDDTAAYRKAIPSGAEDYAELVSLGSVTVSVEDGVNDDGDTKYTLKKSAVRSIVTERTYERIVNYCEVASVGGWEYDGNVLSIYGGDMDANCFNLINAPEGVSATFELYYQDDFVGTFGLGEEFPTLYLGYYGFITFTGVAVGDKLFPMLFNNTLPSEYTSEYHPFYESVTIAEPVDTIELPATLVNDEHWGYGILTSEGVYRGNSYDFRTKKYTKYIDTTYVIDGVNIVAKTFTASSGRVSVQLPEDVADWGTVTNALNVIASGFTTSKSAEDMTVQLPAYNYRSRLVYFYINSDITSAALANEWFAQHPTTIQIARKTAVVETLDVGVQAPLFIKTVSGGNIVFENEAQAKVPSSIKYIGRVQ